MKTSARKPPVPKATPKPKTHLEGLLAPLLQDPTDAAYTARTVLEHIKDAVEARMQERLKTLKPFKADGRTHHEDGRTDEGSYETVSYWYTVDYPTRIHLAGKPAFDLAALWQDALAHGPDWLPRVTKPALTEPILAEIIKVLEKGLADNVSLPHEMFDNEDGIIDWLWDNNHIDDDVTTTTTDSDGNETEAVESLSPIYKFRLRAGEPKFTLSLQGTKLVVRVDVVGEMKLQDVAAPTDYDYDKAQSGRWAAAKRKPKSAPAVGDCYEAAGQYMLNYAKGMLFGTETDLILVHGEVTGQGHLEGTRYGHAWVEKGGHTVIDVSMGRHLEMPKAIYYAMARLQSEFPPFEANVHKYTPEQAKKKINTFKHWGPWDLKTSTGL